MKKIKIALILCSLCIGTSAQAQVIDTAFFQCLYKLDYINDMQNPKEQMDIAILLVGERHTLFASRINFIADSLRRVEQKDIDVQKIISQGQTQMNVPVSPFRRSDNTESYIIHRE